MKWVCQSCGSITNADCPKFCCECGSRDLVKKERKSRDDRIAEYDSRLEEISEVLNNGIEELIPLYQEYRSMIKYFRYLYTRGIIGKDELDRRYNMVKYHSFPMETIE